MLDQNYHTHNLVNQMPYVTDFSEYEYEFLIEKGPVECEDDGWYTGQWLGK